MCGLGGVASTNMIASEIEYARRLGILNMFRGEDSTGMFDVNFSQKSGDQINYWKTTDHPIDFIKNTFMPLRKERWEGTKAPNAIAIHCRAATQGKIIKQNAHPFAFNKLIGMHNGTITKDFPNRKKFGTDSEAIFYNINKYGLKESMKMMNELEPAYALVWYTFDDHRLHFMRNYRRPLHAVYMFGKKTLIWSSEAEHVTMAITSTNGVKPTETPNMLRPLIHYSCDLKADTLKLDEEEIAEAKEVTKTVYAGNFTQGTSYQNSSTSYAATKNTVDADTLEYWYVFGKDVQPNYGTFSEYDEETKKWYTVYCLEKIKALRAAKKKEVTDVANTNTVVAFPPKSKGSEEITATSSSSKATAPVEIPFNDSLPWGPHMMDDDEVAEDEVDPDEDNDSFFDATFASQIGTSNPTLSFAFGPGFTKSCTEAAYNIKIKDGCTCCGASTDPVDDIFWLTDKEYVCESCAQDIAYHQSEHWMHTQGGVSEHTIDRITTEYYTYVYNEPEHNKKVSVH